MYLKTLLFDLFEKNLVKFHSVLELLSVFVRIWNEPFTITHRNSGINILALIVKDLILKDSTLAESQYYHVVFLISNYI